MTWVDWVIVAFTLLLALRGWSRGFVVSALALAGFALGAILGTRVGPLVLHGGSHSAYAPLFSLGGALLLGGIIGALSEGIGNQARRLLFVLGPLRILDGCFGAALTGCLALGTVWILGAILLQVAHDPAIHDDIRASVILRDLDEALPPSGPILNTLARIDPLPSVTGPEADVPAPDERILAAAGVHRASASVVRVTGTACGLGIEGSGWVARPDLVVTNAHVVAGETDTSVRAGDRTLPARALVFDPHNDIAVLRVPGLGSPALALAPDPAPGTAGAILGFPEDGPFDREAGRLGSTRPTQTDNAYGQGPVIRSVAALRGLVRPGNSGGPLVDVRGRVLATVFAEITNAPANRPGGFAVPDAVVARELARAARATHAASTRGCAD